MRQPIAGKAASDPTAAAGSGNLRHSSHGRARSFTRDGSFNELLEIPQILAQRAGQNNRLDNRANFDGHSCRAVSEGIENDHANAKILGHSLPRYPPIGYAHHDQNVACAFFAIDDRCTGKAIGADIVDLIDGREEAGKLFEA